MNTPWTLRVLDPGAAPREVIATPGLTIGRHPECDLTLNDSRVSARHATIVARGATLAVLDLGSNNGTCIDRGRVLGKDQDQVLAPGMRIQLGLAEIEVLGPVTAPETMHGQPVGADEQLTLNATTQYADDASGDAAGAQTAPVPEPIMAAPTPAPAPPPAPPPPAPVPAAAASESGFSPFDSVELNTIVAAADNLLGAQSKLASMGARLVLLNEADLRVVPVSDVEFTIGRSAESTLALKNRGVSQAHARIVFVAASNLFMIEDLGSANGTQLGGAPLVPQVPRELEPDSHIRFGTIEAVFMQDLDSEFHRIPKSGAENAARLLKARGKVSAGVLSQAAKDASKNQRTAGEELLLGQHVSARDWCTAVKDARLASTVRDLSGSGSKRGWLVFLVLLAVAAAVLFALPQGRELIGFNS